MYITELQKYLSLPISKRFIPSHDTWKNAEEKYGIRYPADLIEFIDLYGGGIICDFLNVFSPAAPYYEQVISRILTTYQLRQELTPLGFQLSIWPAQSGLFPIAESESGHHIYFMSKSKDSESKVFVFMPDSNKYSIYESITNLIYIWITRSNEIFSYDWLDEGIKID